MIEAINIVVTIALLCIFILGLISSISVNKKYTSMFKTIEGSYIDKDIFRIEKKYKRESTNHKMENTWLFVEKNYYDLKIYKIPIYILENITIYSMYYAVLIGFTFTFIEIAIITNRSKPISLEGIFLSSIVGLVIALLLIAIRMILGIVDKKEIFTIYMCNYLDNEIDIEEVVEENEASTKTDKVEEIQKKNNVYVQSGFEDNQFNYPRVDDIPSGTKGTESSTRKRKLIDEKILEEAIEQIMS